MGRAPKKSSSFVVETSSEEKAEKKRHSTLEAKKKPPRPTLADSDIGDPDDEVGNTASSYVSSFFSESSFCAENVLPRLHSCSARVSSFLSKGTLKQRPPTQPSPPSPSPSDEAAAADVDGGGDWSGNNPHDQRHKTQKQPKGVAKRGLGRSRGGGGAGDGGGSDMRSQEATAGTTIEGAGGRWRQIEPRITNKAKRGGVKKENSDSTLDLV